MHEEDLRKIVTLTIACAKGGADADVIENILNINASKVAPIVKRHEKASAAYIEPIMRILARVPKQPENENIPEKTASTDDRVVTPEKASTLDGKTVREIKASENGEKEMDIPGLYNSRSTDRTNDPADGKKILPGNLHDEMISNFGTSTGKLVEATLNDTEAEELKGLSENSGS